MFNAAVTTMGCGDRLRVRELAELVLEAVAPGQVTGWPDGQTEIESVPLASRADLPAASAD
jgi:hypothetical protein